MARRTAAAAAETTPEVVDEAANTDAAEAPTEPAAEATAPAAEKVEDKPVDLEPFKASAEAAIGQADKTTGDLSEEVIDSVNKVYREIEGVKGKNQARAWLDEEMKSAIMGKDIFRARSIVNLKDGLSAGSGSSGPKTPADPTTAFVQKVVALRLATDEVIGNVPEGVSEEWTGKADELLASLTDDIASYRAYVASTDEDAEAPEVSPVVRQAFKLASGRGSSGGSGRVAGGPRRDIEKHLIQVFEGLEDGSFLTVNEIAKAASTEYGDDRPSAGAVSARLFPKGRDSYNANGIVAVNEEGSVRGARKTV
jgi:hypothetical protein